MTVASVFYVVLSDGVLEIQAFAQVASYCVGMVAAAGAAWTYRGNSQRERAKWAVQLHHNFYESADYKEMREKLDIDSDAPAVVELVRDEPATFTDYLNFFEMVIFLANIKQLEEEDVLKLFRYYLRRLKQHTVVMKYLNNKEKDFEQLRGFLTKTEL